MLNDSRKVNDSLIDPNPGIEANKMLLEALSEKISSMAIADFTWQYNDSISSIGKHIRHIIDHYSCFLETIAGSYVNYDNRSRLITLETNVDMACKELNSIVCNLSDFSNEGKGPIYVYISDTPNVRPAPVESSLQRELLFLQSHTIHHMAVIQLIFNLLGISVEREFAYAPSTKTFVSRSPP